MAYCMAQKIGCHCALRWERKGFYREKASTIRNENRNKGEHAKYGSNVAIVCKMEVGSHRWSVDGLKDIAYFLVNHVEVVPKGAPGGMGLTKFILSK